LRHRATCLIWAYAMTLNGGTGNDILNGGHYGDTYVFNLGDGHDRINDNQWYSQVGQNDRLVFGAGISASDVNLVRTGNDLVFEYNNGADSVTVTNWYSTASYRIEQVAFADGTLMTNVVAGTDANDNLSGSSGNDYLLGGLGADSLTGGQGNDVYIVDNIGDVVVENSGEGTDTVVSSVSYSLASNVENLTLTGTAAINAIGNALNNTLIGNTGNNTLNGDAGNDIFKGLAGDDIINGGSGNDVLYGGNVVDSTPPTVINQLTINAKATLLNDGVGAQMDVYIDGALKTTFIVTNTQNYQAYTVDPTLLGIGGHSIAVAFSNDRTIAGTPVQDRNLLVNSIVLNGTAIATNANGVYYDIGTGAAALDGNNMLAGNQGVLPWMPSNGALRFNLDGNDWLDGGAGADTMAGGLGNDTYIVESTGDIVTESLNAGFDTVQSSINYDLNNAANVENLILSGSMAINATGNTLSNILTGNVGNNRLDGGLGIDRLAGGLGDDNYVVDNVGDTIVENANSGIDTVESRVTLTLGSNLENLTLTGTAAINGTGNILNNVLKGNSMANSLNGGDGNDTLEGLAGTDTLTGGSGNDTYILGRSYGADIVVENDTTAGNTDIAQFLSGVGADQIWFQHVNNNLEASIIGSTDKLVIKDWYLSTANHVEQFKTTAGAKTLLDSNVQNLVNAMAAFAPPAAGQSTLPQNYQTALAPVIAANWQ